MSDGPDTNPLAFELERGEIERGAVAAGLGVFFYEQAFVRAGQLPPLS